MLLSDIFKIEAVKLNMESSSKDEAISELISTLSESNNSLDREAMISAVEVREEKMNTAIGKGIAVPHGYYPGIDGVFGALGVSERGIDCGAPDGKLVRCFFLVILGESVREKHLRVLNRIMTLVNSEALAHIICAKNNQEINSILSNQGLGGI